LEEDVVMRRTDHQQSSDIQLHFDYYYCGSQWMLDYIRPEHDQS